MLLLYITSSALLCFLMLRWLKRRRRCVDETRLDGKTAIVTGGSSGVGKEAAAALAQRGARVIIACRDAEKAARSVREIRARSRSMNVLHMELDLASMSSVRAFSRSFLQREKRLDLLVNNAGVPGVLDWTDDDFSMCFGVNHLGHFLLTNLLLARLKECSPSRVINLTCSSYRFQKLDLHDLNYNLVPFFTYCRSKLANIYFTQELARVVRGDGVTVVAVHPGYVQSNWTCHFSVLFRILARLLMFLFFVPCEDGAQTVVHCAVSYDVLTHSGEYFTDCRPEPLPAFAKDPAVARKLWEASERLVRLT